MTNPKGGAFERDLLRWFRENGYDAERLRLAGARDEGDLVVKDGHTAIIEAKNCAKWDISGWVSEARAEAMHYDAARRSSANSLPLVVVKKRNAPIAHAYAITRLDELFPPRSP